MSTSRTVVLSHKELVALRELALSFVEPGHAVDGRVTIAALRSAVDALNASEPTRLKRPIVAVTVPMARWIGARMQAWLDSGMVSSRHDALYARWIIKRAGALTQQRAPARARSRR